MSKPQKAGTAGNGNATESDHTLKSGGRLDREVRHEYAQPLKNGERLDTSLLVAEEEEIRTLLGAEQAPPTVRRAVLTEVPIANGTLFETSFLVANVTNATFHGRNLTILVVARLAIEDAAKQMPWGN
jgi:hypothetical protein